MASSCTADAGRYERRVVVVRARQPIEPSGQDDSEDLFTPKRFTLKVKGKTTFTLWGRSTQPDHRLVARAEAPQIDRRLPFAKNQIHHADQPLR